MQSSSRAVEDSNWSNESVGPGPTSFAACDKVYAEWCNSLPEVRGRWIPRTPSGRYFSLHARPREGTVGADE